MKKFYVLLIAFFAIVFCVNAQTVIFSENFDNDASAWTTTDADGDGYCWGIVSYYGLNESNCVVSASCDAAIGILYPDNWLISPPINLTSVAVLKYYAAAIDENYPSEHYGVYISTTGTNITDFTLLFEETMDANGGSAGPSGAKDNGITYKQKTIDLSAYAGATVYIAFRHFNCSDEFYLGIDEIEITEPFTAYNLYVAGVQVNEFNKDDITSAVVAAGKNATGTITYNSETNTLTLNAANISSSEVDINNFIANLRINLIGENEITSTDDGIVINESTTITGGGSLTATSSKAAIWHRKDTLTIENTIVTLNGGTYGISGGDNNEILTINNSIVKATGTNEGSIAKIKNLILNGCAITQPEGAIFDASQKAVCLNGSVVKTEVVIEPEITPTIYELYVTGVQVNDFNKDDILGNGKVTYDPENNTLTIDNASITTTNVQGIKNQIANLTINLLGENSITATNSGIFSSADFTITGTGSLTINANYGIYASECNLTIENTTVTANGSRHGIFGHSNTGILTITNSTVKATGTSYGSIAFINNLVLNNCAITQPTGAEFDAELHAVCVNGGIVKTEVVIESEIAPTIYTVSGTVKDNEDNPIADVTITYNGGTTTTAADGTYSFVATENTNYTVTPSLSGYTFAPATATVNVVDADVTGIDFLGTANAVSPTTYTVSGTVKTLADDSPIEGVTISYNGGGINGTTTTAADGTYSFTAYENTTYTLVANKTGFSFAPATKTVNVAEADLTGVVFFGTALATYTVSGTVRAFANDSPIAGVTISYTGGSTTTASDGIFSFTAEANTTYTVTPSKAGYKFTPATKIVNVAEADVTGVIFFGTADGTPVDETEINAITVYPNPANDYIKVAGLTGNEEILVFDINGRVVKTLEANNNIETISINNLAKGSYMIKVRKENKIEVLKFIK